jgi:hypothetical protein
MNHSYKRTSHSRLKKKNKNNKKIHHNLSFIIKIFVHQPPEISLQDTRCTLSITTLQKYLIKYLIYHLLFKIKL